MAIIRFEGLCAIAALALALDSGIARADPIQITNPEATVVSSDNVACYGDSGPCPAPARPQASPAPIRHGHAHHAPARLRPTAVAANQAPLVFVQQVVAANCNGASAWSLLCPGAQVIGVSY
jgi:hypothetical protein